VLARDAGGRAAQVELDYVVPKLRVAEQRMRAVWEVLDDASVMEVARHRRNHPPDHLPLVRPGHECDRQRFHEMGVADHLVVDHASHL
jgi:hypothetical protein